MMKNTIGKGAVIGLLVGSAVFLFQNCGQNKFETQEESLVMPTAENNEAVNGQSNSGNSSTSNRSSIGPNSTTSTNSMTQTNTSTQSSSPTSTNTQTSANNNSGSNSSASAVNCGTVMSKLGWNASSFIRLDLNPTGNMNMTQSTEYAYDGFGFSFYATSNQADFVDRFRMESSGFQIRLKNKTSGQVITVPTSSYKEISSTNAYHGAGSVQRANGISWARLNIHVKRSFYESYKNQLGEVEVEISCNGDIGPKATQDFKSLSPDLDMQMSKNANGYTYKEGSPSGFAHLECVEEIATGGQVDCHVSGVYIKNIRWFADYQEYPDLANLSAIKGGVVTAGLHYVQAIITYNDGTVGPTLMRFIRAQ